MSLADNMREDHMRQEHYDSLPIERLEACEAELHGRIADARHRLDQIQLSRVRRYGDDSQ